MKQMAAAYRRLKRPKIEDRIRDAAVKRGRSKAGKAPRREYEKRATIVRRVLAEHPPETRLKVIAAVLFEGHGIALSVQAIGLHRAILKADKLKYTGR